MLRLGHKWPDILLMNWWQVNAYIEAGEHDANERLVLMMNVMAVAFGGSSKDRRAMTNTLLGIEGAQFDADEFDKILSGNLATPVGATDDDEAKRWAASQFDADDPAFKVKK